MTHTAHLITTARRAAVVAATGAAALSFAALSAGGASAAPGDPVSDDCMSFSQDSGTTWGAQKTLNYDNTIKPIPGSFARHISFQVKNTCDEAAKFQVLTAKWKVSGGATAQLRADLAGKTGSPLSITGTSTSYDDARTVAESGRLTKNQPITVNLFIGLPQGETAQGFEIDPNWGLFLEEVDANGPTDPGDGDGDGDGGGGNGNGSLDSVFGSLGGGSSEGSLGKASASQFTSAPVVAANR